MKKDRGKDNKCVTRSYSTTTGSEQSVYKVKSIELGLPRACSVPPLEALIQEIKKKSPFSLMLWYFFGKSSWEGRNNSRADVQS